MYATDPKTFNIVRRRRKTCCSSAHSASAIRWEKFIILVLSRITSSMAFYRWKFFHNGGLHTSKERRSIKGPPIACRIGRKVSRNVEASEHFGFSDFFPSSPPDDCEIRSEYNFRFSISPSAISPTPSTRSNATSHEASHRYSSHTQASTAPLLLVKIDDGFFFPFGKVCLRIIKNSGWRKNVFIT